MVDPGPLVFLATGAAAIDPDSLAAVAVEEDKIVVANRAHDLLFVFLTNATANLEGRWLNALPYLAGFNLPGLNLGG